jgi:hypothetical protein
MKLQRYDIDFRDIGQYVSPVEVPQNFGKYCKSEDVEKLEQELKIAKELLGVVNELDGFTEGYMKLKRLNAEMLEVLNILKAELEKEDSVITDTFWYSDYETMLDRVDTILGIEETDEPQIIERDGQHCKLNISVRKLEGGNE